MECGPSGPSRRRSGTGFGSGGYGAVMILVVTTGVKLLQIAMSGIVDRWAASSRL
jgi:hypothetical protein